MAESTKQARYFTYDECKARGKQAIAEGKILQVYVHHPNGATESTMTGVMTGVMAGETPEAAAVRLVKDLEGVDLDETHVERMPRDEQGIMRVKVLVPEKKEAASRCPICATPRTGGCRCPGPHTLEDLKKGHGCTCVNGHRWSGDLSWDPNQEKEASKKQEVYAVDLDGTLAHHDPEAEFDPEHIGEPVKSMRRLVRLWTRRGIQVVILTARASSKKNIDVVKAWLAKHGMEGLEVTNIKSPGFTKIFDDRAVQVEQNTGRLIKEAGFRRPENFDTIKKLSTKDYTIEAGANDWENSWTAATMQPANEAQRVWIELPDIEEEKWHDDGEQVVNKWVRLARETHGRDGGGRSWVEAFEHAAKELKREGLILAHGTEKQVWQEKPASALDALAPGQTAPVTPPPIVIDPMKTGPDAIYRALQNLNLDQVEAESMDIVRRKLKSKRPAAVEKLGFIQGLRKTGILPHELMISRVPVIPPMYRPHSVAGDTFVPGDANELYRDLLNLRNVHADITSRLVGRPVEESTLRLYDAVRSVYGFQDPVVPKTAERGVTGFLKQVTGTSPKFCHDDLTEVLTSDGWVRFAELDPSNLPAVWTINPATNYPQLQQPQGFFIYAVDGSLIQGLGAGVDFLVTDEHRMRVCSPLTDWMFITARELLDRQFEPLVMMRTSLSDVSTLEHHMLKRVPYTGKVYCLTVTNSTLVTRRNGVPLVSGNSFVQRKLLSRDSDFTGRGVITLAPSLGMDEVGLPDDMAWKIYGPHVQRRLVRSGLQAEEAIRHLRDRSSIAERHLDAEMSERPVIYSRAPAWHKFNVIGGKPKRVKGSSIVISPFVTTGGNADFDGDSGRFVVRIRNVVDAPGDPLQADPMLNAQHQVKTNDGNIHISSFPRLEDTRVELRPGVQEYDVPPGVRVYALDRETMKHAWLPVTKFSEHQHLEIWRVGLRSGASVFPSKEHSMLAYRDGKVEVVSPSDLVGLCVPKVRGFSDARGTVDNVMASGKRYTKDLTFKLKLNRDVGVFLGLLIGDGCVNVSGLLYLYGKGEKAANRRKFEEILNSDQLPYSGYFAETRFDTPSLGAGSTERERTTVSDCSWFSKWIKDQIGGESLVKRLPDFSLNARREHQLGLLDGLLSSDGSVSVSNGKSKPQLMVSYSTSSPDLVSGLQCLLTQLGVTSSVSDYVSKESGRLAFIVTLSTVGMRRLVEADGFTLTHPNKNEVLLKHASSVSMKNGAVDMVPYPQHLDQVLKQAYNLEHQKKTTDGKTYFGSLGAYRQRGFASRAVMQEMLDLCRKHQQRSPELETFQKLVADLSLDWDPVLSASALPEPMTGWDITVPGALTFTLDSGVVVQDTMTVHVPSTADAVKDTYAKLMPSKMLFSIKEPDAVVPQPKHEYLLGIHGAQTRPARQKHAFASRAEALAAAKAGKISLSDEVEFPS